MKTRCYYRRAPYFKYYGGRGIAVCSEWREDFQRFLADMGPCPEKWSLERIDNDGDYMPQNCVWASHKAQSQNTRRSRRIVFDGQVLTIAAIAERMELPYHTLHNRMVRHNEDALTAVRHLLHD